MSERNYLRKQESKSHEAGIAGQGFDVLKSGVTSATLREMADDRELFATLQSRGFPEDEDSCREIAALFNERFDPHEIAAQSAFQLGSRRADGVDPTVH